MKLDLNTMGLCEMCGSDITEQFLFQVGTKYIHDYCLTCRVCKKHLSTDVTCFERNGKIFCKLCYYKLGECKGCCRRISSSDFVMQVKGFYYHIDCFRCSICNLLLETGDHFGLKNQQLFCEYHFLTLANITKTLDSQTSSIVAQKPPSVTPNTGQCSKNYDVPLTMKTSSNHIIEQYTLTNKLQRENIDDTTVSDMECISNELVFTSENESLKTQSTAFNNTTKSTLSSSPSAIDKFQRMVSIHSTSSDSDMVRSVSSSCSDDDEQKPKTKRSKERKSRSKDGRPKRVRTTFNQKQLVALKEFFETDKNPDSKALEKLSEKMQLKKRVLQVWFQNARAKHRKGQSSVNESVEKTSADELCFKLSRTEQQNKSKPHLTTEKTHTFY